jgi:hypothetical protein
MPRRILERIRDAVRERRYDMTKHAIDELAEDALDFVDLETSIFVEALWCRSAGGQTFPVRV